METMLMEQTVVIRDLDHVRLREWLDHLAVAEERGSDYINALRRKLCDAEVVTVGEIPRDVVTMNSLVGLRDVELDEKLTCFLAYPDEADLLQRRVSVAVPLGTEMLGRPVGAVIACPVPSGIRQMRIERVYYQPEAAGDYYL